MKVKIYREEMFGGISMVFYEDRLNGKRFIAKPVDLEFEEYNDGAEYRPTLRLNSSISNEFLQQLAEELDSKGVKTDKDAKIEGTLNATKYHLEDLRKLLKLI